jgi:hypothetical protein
MFVCLFFTRSGRLGFASVPDFQNPPFGVCTRILPHDVIQHQGPTAAISIFVDVVVAVVVAVVVLADTLMTKLQPKIRFKSLY